MMRDSNSSRSQKWFARNSLDVEFCKEYVDDLCKVYFGFKDYSFVFFDGDSMALCIKYGILSYIIYADRDEVRLKLLEQNSNEQSKNKYHELKTFSGDNCWFECLHWIKNRYSKQIKKV